MKNAVINIQHHHNCIDRVYLSIHIIYIYNLQFTRFHSRCIAHFHFTLTQKFGVSIWGIRMLKVSHQQ